MKSNGEPRLASLASWLVLVASFGLSSATWIALATLAGFSGDVFGLFPLAWLMPATVDGYIVVALVLWMSPVPSDVARFARINTYAAASVGVAAQSAYHALTVYAATGLVWRLVMAAVVGALPPAVAALAVHMRALVRRKSGRLVPSVVPSVVPEIPQVTAPPATEVLPRVVPAIPPDPAGRDEAAEKIRKAPPASAPKRPFAVTQRAAAALQADGMEVPQIAEALGISERQVRNALRPVPVNRPE